MKPSKSMKRKPGPNHPWLHSWSHLTPQGLAEFGQRQAARLKAVGKQTRVKVV